eukprot:scaffold51031_cov63-Attheya_sp.AAC.4
MSFTFTLLEDLFENDRMKRHGTMWDQTDGCGKQYRCCITHYLLSVLFVNFQIVIDRAVDTPGHGKDVVDGFNAVHKRFLMTCLRMTSTPKVHDSVTDSKRMLVHSMTEKGEVSFAAECTRLLLNRDMVGTLSGDKKRAKHKANARLKDTFYHIHDDELRLKCTKMKPQFVPSTQGSRYPTETTHGEQNGTNSVSGEEVFSNDLGPASRGNIQVTTTM